jgi:hypothetical protein
MALGRKSFSTYLFGPMMPKQSQFWSSSIVDVAIQISGLFFLQESMYLFMIASLSMKT